MLDDRRRAELRAAIKRDGYVIVRGLLTDAEIRRLRDGLLDHFDRVTGGRSPWHWEGLGKHQPAAASMIPSIAWLFSHRPIVDTFRELLADEPRFTGNCDAHMNMLSWWHKDTSEGKGGCFIGDYFAREQVNVFRAGVYLQDHHLDGNGLRVRPGSQRTRSVVEGTQEVLASRAGDVIFFDIRLSHAGQMPDLLENVLLHTARRTGAEGIGFAAKEAWRKLRSKQRKLSIFFTYGDDGQDAQDYRAFEAASRST